MCVGICVLLAIVFVLCRTGDRDSILATLMILFVIVVNDTARILMVAVPVDDTKTSSRIVLSSNKTTKKTSSSSNPNEAPSIAPHGGLRQ